MSFMDHVRDRMVQVDGRQVSVPETAKPRELLEACGRDPNSRDLVSQVDNGMTRIHPKDNEIRLRDGDVFESQISGRAGA